MSKPTTTIEAIENEEYHGITSHVGSSMLTTFRQSRRRYEAMYEAQTLQPKPPTKAMDFGTAVHSLILQPNDFKDVVTEIPTSALHKSGARRNNAGQKNWTDFLADNPNTILLTADEAKKARKMRDSAFANPMAGALLKADGGVEASIFWTCQQTGIQRKCRPDKWINKRNMIVDIKTTVDASPEGFGRQVAKFDYHVKAPFYVHGFEEYTGVGGYELVFIAIENEAPFRTAVYGLGGFNEMFQTTPYQFGESLVWRGLEDLARCREAEDFSETNENVVTDLQLPQYAYYKE